MSESKHSVSKSAGPSAREHSEASHSLNGRQGRRWKDQPRKQFRLNSTPMGLCG